MAAKSARVQSDRSGQHPHPKQGAVGPKDKATKGLLSAKQAAVILGVAPSLIYAICQSNRLAHYRVGEKGGVIRIRPADLRRYLRTCRVESALPRVGPAGMTPSRPGQYKHIRMD